MSRVILTSLMPTVILSSLTGYQGFSVSSPSSVTFSVAGPKGDAGRGLVWKGDYNETAVYIPMDAVTWNGSSYVCDVGCTRVDPSDGVHWSMLASAAGAWESLDLGPFA